MHLKTGGSAMGNDKFIEVQCYLHTLCNLGCKFCFQNDENGIRENNKINLDYIKSLPGEISEVILPIMKRDGIGNIRIIILGGELFSDNIPDSMFDVYREFVYELQSKLRKEIPDLGSKLLTMTNGIYTKHERIEKFLREFNGSIAFSYDPIDRFNNDAQREIWHKTLKYFYGIGLDVFLTNVLTKKNIYAYINEDSLFDRIPNDVYAEIVEYSPGLNYHDYLPNDDDIFNFYKWALDNGKFNISHIGHILEHTEACDHEITYSFGEYLHKQYNKSYANECNEIFPFTKDEYYGACANKIEDPNDCGRCKESLAYQKRGCFSCEYYGNCPKMCCTQILFDKYEITQCPISRVYKYLEENPNILVKYNNWRESK